jgi:hypothetical protein
VTGTARMMKKAPGGPRNSYDFVRGFKCATVGFDALEDMMVGRDWHHENTRWLIRHKIVRLYNMQSMKTWMCSKYVSVYIHCFINTN